MKPGDPLPNGWRWARLAEICKRPTGTRDPREQPGQQFQYVDISSISNADKRIVEARTLLGSDAPSRARQVIRAGDVLVATTRPNLNAVALVPAALDNEIASTGFCVLRPTIDLDTRFLFAWVRSAPFVRALSALVVGALYPAVTDSQVLSQSMPFPPLPEQRRIATVLAEQFAAVSRAREAAQARVEALDALPFALLSRAFRGEC